MSEQTPAVTPAVATPQAPVIPVAPPAPKSSSEWIESKRPSATPPTPAAPATPAVAPQTAAEKRLLKWKKDGAEYELDLDEEWKDEARREKLRQRIEKGDAWDDVLPRRERAAAEKAAAEARETSKAAWNNWLDQHGYTAVQDATHASGWKLVPKQQVATPATTAPEDPLAKEESELRSKIKNSAGEPIDPDWLDRLSEIRALRAKQDAVKEIKAEREAELRAESTRRAAAEQTAKQQDFRIQTEKWRDGHIERLIAARAADFDGPDADQRKERVRIIARHAAATIASEARVVTNDEIVAAMQKAVFDDADGLRAREKLWRDKLPTAPAKAEAPAVIGTSPTGGGTKLTYEQERDAWIESKRQGARR